MFSAQETLQANHSATLTALSTQTKEVERLKAVEQRLEGEKATVGAQNLALKRQMFYGEHLRRRIKAASMLYERKTFNNIQLLFKYQSLCLTEFLHHT